MNRNRSLPALSYALMLAGSLVGLPGLAQEPPELPVPPPDMPEAFTQLIPRGKIESVDLPVFVAAKEAELSRDAWVLGVVIEGEARAYSLNLLNRHEVVNDRIGKTAFAAVW